MKRYDVCMCEPFILPGILPTLGLATIKSILGENGLTSKILYPSLHYFVENEIFKNSLLLSLVEDTPLQLVEFLFVDSNRKKDAINYIYNSLSERNMKFDSYYINEVLNSLHSKALEMVTNLAYEIADLNPYALFISTTFGDLNFDIKLMEKVKELNPQIQIVCGGSNCDLSYSKKLMEMTKALDAVICDETGFISVLYTNSIKNNSCLSNSAQQFITTKDFSAKKVCKISSLDDLPCPDFEDFFDSIIKLGIDRRMITLPYEFARGCWWAEYNPCSMCGFFGFQKNYIHKNPHKVIRDLEYLIEAYNIERIRFSDLVNPKTELIESLSMIENKNLKLFWELRPDLTEDQIASLRSIGLTCGQIGIESFSTNELFTIRKGTNGISNIRVLRLLSEYKIEVIWNYLYGFSNDEAEWYEEIIKVMPSLFHLQPPFIRKIWINRFSELFDNSDKNMLLPIGESSFHDETLKSFDFFYKVIENEHLKTVYEELREMIQNWRNAFSQHFSLLATSNSKESILIKRNYGELEEEYLYEGLKASMYFYFSTPHTLDECILNFGDAQNVYGNIDVFMRDKTVVFLDNQYLSIACFPTQYKWTKHFMQPSYAGSMLFKESN